ncbi:adaptin ear-binding coat-associated protein 1 NECAP-1 [Laetiporus sulphureus 93-53]|uniref:Adaptin ear-binding coat-associated protein 1 NECAP-1 n=1 Tax=Laetiporus sulphureus 93-53 TaxID=1314785 RepID=A0A165G3T7_9APHY|nr:adaptin ear-binding coat-associated protein 1 NECAP-1 [Laetiporus sulphureus 93-53]KZT09789.1 adaptin ear-binding coat-associated protein 1 NECAP-1 [Laetiporus sulphureus 93-53]
MDEFGGDDEIESVLYIGREVSVFKIPPLKKNEGHRAQEWGDLAAPLWKGRLRIIERSTGVSIQFEDPNTGELFAKADYDPAKPSVEAVLDSSRYFVVRVEDDGRRAYIGMGFLERTDSFDFNVTLQDYTKRWRARMNPSEPGSEDSPSPHVPAGPKKDYSLKEGQTFSINIPGRTKANNSSSSSTTANLLGDSTASLSSSSGGLGVPLLPPPPSAPKKW